jgi:hypothetical protein
MDALHEQISKVAGKDLGSNAKDVANAVGDPAPFPRPLALKVIPWMKLTDDTMFIVEMNRIITMTEVNDSSIIKVYQKYIRERNKISSKSQLSSNMGFISSIADARVSLEKLYKSNSKT